MHKLLPLVLPEAAANLSAQCVLHPANSIALSGQLMFSHVSVKIMTFEPYLIHFFARERTLVRKLLGKGIWSGVSFSLARSPLHLSRLCLCSVWVHFSLSGQSAQPPAMELLEF